MRVFTTNRTRFCPVDRVLSFVVRSVTIEDALGKLLSFALISWTNVWQCSHRKASTLESVDVGLAGDSLRREKSFERIDREFPLGEPFELCVFTGSETIRSHQNSYHFGVAVVVLCAHSRTSKVMHVFAYVEKSRSIQSRRRWHEKCRL